MIRNFKNTLLVSSVLTTQLLSSLSFAQPASVAATTSASQLQTSTTTVTAEKKDSKAFALELGIEYSQKVATEEKGERESSTDMTLAPSYKINSILTAVGNVVFSKENSGARQNSVSNTQVVLNVKGIKINEELETLHSLGGIAPTNDDSIKRDRLRGGVVLTNGLRLIKSFVKVDYKLGLAKNFHEFTENAEGTPNIEYRLSNALSVIIPITERFSISALGIYRIGRTYKGFQKNAFEINADINYDILDQLSVNLGTSNDGSALKSNGVDSNIAAYNENTSVIRAGLTLTL